MGYFKRTSNVGTAMHTQRKESSLLAATARGHLSQEEYDTLLSETVQFQTDKLLSETVQFQTDKDKEAYFIKNHMFESNMETWKEDGEVACCHCLQDMKIKDFKAVIEKGAMSDGSDFEKILCKNYPVCDGVIIDWYPSGTFAKKGNKV